MRKLILIIILTIILNADAPSLTETRILISQAAGIPHGSNIKTNKSVSLSQLLLSIDPFGESKKNPKVLEDFKIPNTKFFSTATFKSY